MTDSSTILGFDYGEARIGVARVDSFVKIPEALQTVVANDWKALEALIEQHKPSMFVVGLPRSLDGTLNAQAEVCRQFADKLLSKFGIKVVMQDESLTTVSADRLNEEQGLKMAADSLAACIILEDYLREQV